MSFKNLVRAATIPIGFTTLGLFFPYEAVIAEELFFNDKLLKYQLKEFIRKNPEKAREAGLSMTITSADLREARIGECNAYEKYDAYPSYDVRQWCERYAPTRYMKPKQVRARSTPECKANGICKAFSGRDLFDMPVIPGWYILENHAKRVVSYFKPQPERVNVRSATDRYIAQESVFRYYREPRAGTAPSTTTIGEYQSSCYDTGYGMNCTTTPPTRFTTPGTSARPGGVVQHNNHIIYDCKDETVGWHRNGKLDGKWKSVSQPQDIKFVKKYCPIIKSLPLSSFSKYKD